MGESFILSCESTVDLPFSYVDSRNIPVLFYTYLVDGQEYVDDMGRDPDALPLVCHISGTYDGCENGIKDAPGSV